MMKRLISSIQLIRKDKMMENIVISAKQMTRVAGLQKNFVIITTVLGFFFSTAKIVTHSQKKNPADVVAASQHCPVCLVRILKYDFPNPPYYS